MTENRQQQQSKNAEYVEALNRLLDTARNQGKNEYVDALTAAIDSLKGADKDSRESDDLQMSGTPAEQLLKLAADVKANKTSPQQRMAAAAHLAFLAGHR